jgi:Flp pilus assembly protein TadG
MPNFCCQENKMKKIREQSGASLIEFVIVLIPLLVLLFASIEFGVAGYNKAMITNASREGARRGIVYDYSQSDGRVPFSTIRDVIHNYCDTHVISFGSGSVVTVDPPIYQTINGNTYLTISVSYNYGFLVMQNLIPFFNPTLNLQAVSTMRMEG